MLAAAAAELSLKFESRCLGMLQVAALVSCLFLKYNAFDDYSRLLYFVTNKACFESVPCIFCHIRVNNLIFDLYVIF